MNESIGRPVPPWRRPDYVPPRPPPPPPRRPPGPLKLGPYFSARTRPEETIRFRFRTRCLCAAATPVDDVHDNVRRLHVQPCIVQRFIQALVCFLPSLMRVWFESFFPEWNLPSELILKKQKEGWEEEFDTEKAAYARLRLLQGVVIPEFLGEVRCDNTRAILLSDVGGACLATPEGSLLQVADLRRMLHQALTAFASFRILPDDIKLDNFHYTRDKVMIVDLERVSEEPLSDEHLDIGIKSTVNQLAKSYENNQYVYWTDGLIAIDT